MDLRYTAPEEEFRRELRTWLAATLPGVGPPPAADDWTARRAYDLRWQRLLHDAGYAGVDWPTEGGGRGASPVEQLIFKEECERAGAPYVGVNFVGLLHAGPTVIAEGTLEQKERYLPPILRGEEVWCQGFSEPDAGSDLASLRTRAVRDGGDYVVTGSKIWTSHAEVADFCELLVRTGGDGHRGISWLIMPMDVPGISIRPLRTMEGSTEFAELFLDEVRVPVANRVGDENDGWRVTMVTLSFERGTAFVGELLESVRLLGEVRRLAERLGLLDDAGVARRIGHLVAAFDALVGLDQAQRVGGRPDRRPRYRRLRVQAVVLRARTSVGRPRRGDPRSGRAVLRPARERRRRGVRQPRAAARLVQVDFADDRRRHLAGPAQHRGRAHPRPAQGAALDGLQRG